MKIKVNNNILVWARKSLNLSQDIVAKRMGKNVETIRNWEEGRDFPTYAQLEKLSYSIYKKPIAIFFFPEPPNNVKRQDKNFRTLDNDVFMEIPSKILEKVNEARVMQLNLQEISISEKKYIQNFNLNIYDNRIYSIIRQKLNVSLDAQKSIKKYSEAFEIWRNALYECGVYVFKDAFKENEFSGFCLYDEKFPVIYINNSISFSRQIFTLFHELCHIIIKTNGIDKIDDDYLERLSNKNKKIETFCNCFAGNFLVPDEDLLKEIDKIELNNKNIEKISKIYKVSSEVIYRKLLNLNKISKEMYEKVHNDLKKENYRLNNKNNNGGDYYNTKKSYLGSNYILDVYQNYYDGKINIYDVSNYLNIKIENIPNLGNTLKTNY